MTELGEDAVLADAQAAYPQHEDLRMLYEHGGRWVGCLLCGTTWAVVPSGFEQVGDGDGTCRGGEG